MEMDSAPIREAPDPPPISPTTRAFTYLTITVALLLFLAPSYSIVPFLVSLGLHWIPSFCCFFALCAIYIAIFCGPSLYIGWRILERVIMGRVARRHMAPFAKYAYIVCGFGPAVLISGFCVTFVGYFVGKACLFFLGSALLQDKQPSSENLFGESIANVSLSDPTGTLYEAQKQLTSNVIPAIKSFPVWILVLSLFIYSYGIIGFIPERTKQFLIERYALRRRSATLRSVTASAMSIGLGMSYSMWWLTGLLFWFPARFHVATSEIIGVRVFQNSLAQSPGEKKSPIFIPVLLNGTLWFILHLFIVILINNVAFLVDQQNSDAAAIAFFKWFLAWTVLSLVVLCAAPFVASRISFQLSNVAMQDKED